MSHPVRLCSWPGMLAALPSILLLAGCGDLPRDAHDTLAAARRGKPLRVGYSPAPPMVLAGRTGPRGREVELLRQWAAREGVTLHWTQMGETQLVEGLSRGDLDLAVAGFRMNDPRAARIGMTLPYDPARRHVIAVRPVESALTLSLDRHIAQVRR